MNSKELYKIWAPDESVWSAWVRPVPFLNAEKHRCLPAFELRKIYCLSSASNGLAVIIDHPSEEGIKEGLALSLLGFRPVPLYNGVNAQESAAALVDNSGIENALLSGAGILKSICIPNNAPPVFLLDSNRVSRFKMNVSIFDNSYDAYPQDFPSPDFLLKHKITTILIISDKIRKDLALILKKYQDKGLVIIFSNGYDKPVIKKIKKHRKLI